MKKLTAAQTKSITNAKDQVKAAANVMIETQRQGGEGGPTNPASPSDVVAALRRHEWVRIMQEAADLIESQERRIKELEAWRDSWVKCPEGAAAQRIKELEASLASMVQGVKISIPTQTMEQEFQSHYRRGYEAGKATLSQRIVDAPVVAHITEDGKVFSNGFVRDTDKPLISKEDLK